MKIIQFQITPNNADWQGVLLGLGDDGCFYVLLDGEWQHVASSPDPEKLG